MRLEAMAVVLVLLRLRKGIALSQAIKSFASKKLTHNAGKVSKYNGYTKRQKSVGGRIGMFGSQEHNLPGSARPVYGAKYGPNDAPPLPQHHHQPPSANQPHADRKDAAFVKFAASTWDAWGADVDDSGVIDPNRARAAAESVLASHQSGQSSCDLTPSLRSAYPATQLRAREKALQRLAAQCPDQQRTGSTGGSPPSTGVGAATVAYPRLPAVNAQHKPASGGKQAGGGEAANSEQVRQARILRLVAGVGDESINLTELRKLCWKGVPRKARPAAWRILSGYVPASAERWNEVLQRKRDEYLHYVQQYFDTRHDDVHQETFRQIQIDIPRMCPLVPLFQQRTVQELFERILFIWAIRHPASGYVQGINDLVTPFFVVFLSEVVTDDASVANFDLSRLPRRQLEIVEADSFWCVSKLLDSIQDNYTFAQPGIQRKVLQLASLMSRVDNALHAHLTRHGVEYLQFAFRWMNNVLMREVPLRATIRLWDTYLCEPAGFADFHVYVCAALLRAFSATLLAQPDFQSLMTLVQNLPTADWGDRHIAELTADAYSLKTLFAGAQSHLA